MISSKQAVDIIEEMVGRRPHWGILKKWADQGRISRVAVHSRCALYDPEEIRQAAKDFGKQRSTLGNAKPLSALSLR